jgi:hypothetical protein
MNISKLSAFVTAILLAFGITATLGMLISAFWLWVSDWLMNQQGFSFWQTSWVIGAFWGFVALLKAVPDLQKSANKLADGE